VPGVRQQSNEAPPLSPHHLRWPNTDMQKFLSAPWKRRRARSKAKSEADPAEGRETDPLRMLPRVKSDPAIGSLIASTPAPSSSNGQERDSTRTKPLLVAVLTGPTPTQATSSSLITPGPPRTKLWNPRITPSARALQPRTSRIGCLLHILPPRWSSMW